MPSNYSSDRMPLDGSAGPGRQRWHVSKEVSLAVIFAIVSQSAILVWWARGQVARDDDLERRVTSLERERELIKGAERMAVLEASIAEIRRSNLRMEAMVSQYIDKQGRVAR